MSNPITPFGNEPMTPWLTIPFDWRRPHTSRGRLLYWSNEYQFGQLYPRPGAQDIAAFYNLSDYYTHDVSGSKGVSRARITTAWRLMRRLSWQFDKSVYLDQAWFARHYGAPPQRVLDLGCGNGEILTRVRSLGHEVLGVEPDPAARETAARRGISVLPGTAEALPPELEGQTFDAVLMTHVLEHCLDPVLAVRNAANLLHKGGLLTLETPNNQALGLRFAGATWRWLDVPRHLNFFTGKSLRAICELVGLKVKFTEYRGYTRQFQPDWVADEQLIWDLYRENVPQTALPLRNSGRRSFKLLLKTLSAPDEKRYDSVRVTAEKV